jgi:hypothetical protein
MINLLGASRTTHGLVFAACDINQATIRPELASTDSPSHMSKASHDVQLWSATPARRTLLHALRTAGASRHRISFAGCRRTRVAFSL